MVLLGVHLEKLHSLNFGEGQEIHAGAPTKVGRELSKWLKANKINLDASHWQYVDFFSSSRRINYKTADS